MQEFPQAVIICYANWTMGYRSDLYLYFNDSKAAKPLTAVTVVRIKESLKTDIRLPRIHNA